MTVKAPSEDIKDILVTASVGKFTGATASDWQIFIGSEQPTPDKAITLYDSGGINPSPRPPCRPPAFSTRSWSG